MCASPLKLYTLEFTQHLHACTHTPIDMGQIACRRDSHNVQAQLFVLCVDPTVHLQHAIVYSSHLRLLTDLTHMMGVQRNENVVDVSHVSADHLSDPGAVLIGPLDRQ